MDLIDDEALTASWVVANRDMNRERGLTGRDGYTRVLGVDIATVLTDLLSESPKRTVAWLDLCCGSGGALREAASLLRERDRLSITGIDLVSGDEPPPEIRLVTASVTDWRPDERYDLITCVHGLHYVGDKLGLLARASSWLTPDGQLVANFDAAGIRLSGGAPAGRRLTNALRAAGFVHDGRTNRIHRHGPADVELPFRYLGADDRAGPNYTGQPAVHSYYEPR
ncbi:class I SAM-dependent methyltransferase [Actinophytocola sp.]|uniref:class I SAM-dependent methyltransferase n=1 Tax=Actinophytocola sp. TaxID=1872138 RepID=UPI002ED56766